MGSRSLKNGLWTQRRRERILEKACGQFPPGTKSSNIELNIYWARTRGPASNYYNRNDGNDEPGSGGGRKTGVLGQIAKHICQRITQDLCNSFFHKIYIVKMP